MASENKYDREHLRNISSYLNRIDEIYRRATDEVAKAVAASGAKYDPDRPFSFDDYPSVRRKVDRAAAELSSQVERTIVNGIKAQWELSNRKNDDLVETVTGRAAEEFPEALRNRYFATNEEARNAFVERATKGMNLSEEVWRFKKETGFGVDISLKRDLDLGLAEGTSAADLSRQLRKYLKNDDMLFRRVRSERGALVLSRNARLFHPGQGVYRSSYMNARRLAATETNMAYRSADYERWKELDFVVGIEIRTSNNHTTKDSSGKTVELEDICDTLAGRYPKDFKFVGWHPHCRCIATTILKTEEEMEADTERIMDGEEPLPPSSSENYIGELPDRFTKWLDKNAERIENAKSLPYFLKDNQKLIEEGGVSATPTATPTTQTEQQTPKGVDYTQENAAIEEYVGGEGMWVNQYLRGRGDFGQLSEEEQRYLDELTDITSRETVGVQTLYRSVNADAIFGDMSDFSYEYLKEHYIYGVDNPVTMQKIQRYLGVEGKQLTEKGFMSTSRDREIVENWGDYTGSEHPVVMVIRTDGTTTGFDVGRYTKLHHPEIEAADPQAEILLSRGQRYEVEKVYGKDGNIVVEVKLLPEKNSVALSVTNATNTATAPAGTSATTTATAPAVSKLMPDELKPKSDYLKGEDYTFSKDFFDLLDPNKPVTLEIKDGSNDSCASYDGSKVTIGNGSRAADSEWQRKRVVYHEYGHCIDDQRDLKNSKEIADLMGNQKKYLKAKNEKSFTELEFGYNDEGVWGQWPKSVVYKTRVQYVDKRLEELNYRISDIKDETFAKYGITRDDVREQIGATRDTIKSLVVKYGYGHSAAYFKMSGHKEAEFLAHSFENAFIGNRIFKKYLPEMYEDMIEYIKSLK